MTDIIIVGAAGRMGQMLVRQTQASSKATLRAVTEREGSDFISKDVGDMAGLGPINISISDSLHSVCQSSSIIIDFTAVSATLSHLEVVKEKGKGIVIGTTGFQETELQTIKEASKKIPIVLAPNMSVGVNVLFKLVQEATQYLHNSFDIEILESHHRHKKDAPSGTAVKLGQLAAESSARSYPQDANFHREGICGPRTEKEIGMQTLRGGDVVGEHTVFYYGEGERIEISHRATDRKIFADGAVKAAIWLNEQKPGLYDMWDVLGIRG